MFPNPATEPARTPRSSTWAAPIERLGAVESRYRSLLEGLPLVTFVFGWESGRRMRYISPQVEALLGFDQAEWLEGGGLWDARLHPEDRGRVLEAAGEAFAAGRPLRMEYRLLRRDGRAVWVREETDPPVALGDGPRLTHGVLVDVSERRATENALERERARAEGYRARLEAIGDGAAASDAVAGPAAAPNDPLTGLVTRPGLEERLHLAVDAARDSGEEVALLCIDIDSFKLVNDSLGLEAGDELLRQVSARLCRLVGANDALARPGADEFLLMLGRARGRARASTRARRHRAAWPRSCPSPSRSRAASWR
ncbi:MAG: diguanylate cyclase [Thermoleophilaceae bacterium]